MNISSELRNSLKLDLATKYDNEITNYSPHEYINLLEKPLIDEFNSTQYNQENSTEIYRNFLNWLFLTFKENEVSFRIKCLERLGDINGQKILLVGCGLGEDVAAALSLVNETGVVHAQDLSETFIKLAATKNLYADNVVFSVSNALSLPYRDDYFDAVYHFGGINLFGDTKRAISEFNRVCKVGGSVTFGDESLAMHLRSTDYGKMFMQNNPLWREYAPLKHLPLNAINIKLEYILGNCFYLISFKKNEGLPEVNIDVPHKGLRGGTIRKRFFGQVESIDPLIKEKLYHKAKRQNNSVSDILEKLVRNYLD